MCKVPGSRPGVEGVQYKIYVTTLEKTIFKVSL